MSPSNTLSEVSRQYARSGVSTVKATTSLRATSRVRMSTSGLMVVRACVRVRFRHATAGGSWLNGRATPTQRTDQPRVPMPTPARDMACRPASAVPWNHGRVRAMTVALS